MKKLCVGFEPTPLVWHSNALTHYTMGHLGGGVVTDLLLPLSDIPNNIEYKFTIEYFAKLTVDLMPNKMPFL